MSRDIRISIVTVVLNEPTELMRTAQSIVSQEYRNIEWIVKDGGSSDNSLAEVEALVGTRFRYKCVSGPDKGIYDAMNTGVSLATGEYLVFVNAGDVFPEPGTMSLVVEALSRDLGSEPPGILYGGARLVFKNGSSVDRPPRNPEKTLWHGLPANHQATYFRRDLLHDAAYDTSYRVCGDYYLVALLEARGVTSTQLNEVIIDFAVGGFSFRNPLLLHLEPARIQKDILHKSRLFIAISFCRRFLSTTALAVLAFLRK